MKKFKFEIQVAASLSVQNENEIRFVFFHSLLSSFSHFTYFEK